MTVRKRASAATNTRYLEAATTAIAGIARANRQLVAQHKRLRTVLVRAQRAARAIQAGNADGNAQMIKVQIAMQRENTLFTSISNVLKTRHDTAKNSIGNIR